MVGVTGSGKSSFISTLLGKDIGIGHEADPCKLQSRPCFFSLRCRYISGTKDCKVYLLDYGDTRFELIDTPGFDDPTRDGIDILRNISNQLNGVAGVIYCHRATETRLNGDDRLNLEVVKAMCGERFFSRVVICSTHWDTTAPGSREGHRARMESLLDKEFGSIMENGGMYKEFLGETEPQSCIAVLVLFLAQRRPPRMSILKQQSQMPTRETNAGRVIEDDYRKRQKGKLARRQSDARSK